MDEDEGDSGFDDVAPSPTTFLRVAPFSRGNSYLWVLKKEVEDDRHIRILKEIAKLIRLSESLCEDAETSGPKEYAEIVADAEGDYIEELIGAALLILQAKIRRVVNAAVFLTKAMKSSHHIEIASFADADKIKTIGGAYKDTETSVISYVWALANYFKHRDEWTHDVWATEKELSEFSPQEKPRKMEFVTREIVQRAGIVEFSTGNMRTGLEFLGICPYSSCTNLARQVQEWADEVYKVGTSEIAAAVDSPSQPVISSCLDFPITLSRQSGR